MLSSALKKVKPNPDMYEARQGGPKGLSWEFDDDKA